MTKTLILPCAGKSSRYPNMKPKWLLTHPDGMLMLQKVLSGLKLEIYTRIIITVVQEHIDKYEADVILEQALNFNINHQFEICVLSNYTASPAETIFQTLKTMNISGCFTVKDSDSYVRIDDTERISFIAGVDLNDFKGCMNDVRNKSYIILGGNYDVSDIVEKKVVSSNVAVGLYGFEDSDSFCDAYQTLLNRTDGEIFMSHIISELIRSKVARYYYIQAVSYEDWGTRMEWRAIQSRLATYIVDIDGVLLKNTGRYGVNNWYNSSDVLHKNIDRLKQLFDDGAQIVLMTCRPPECIEGVIKLLEEKGIIIHSAITNCNHACRIIVNDFASSNPYPSCEAINILRNADLNEYI